MLWIQLVRLIGIFIAIIMVWITGIRKIQRILKSDDEGKDQSPIFCKEFPEKQDPPKRDFVYFASKATPLVTTISQALENQRHCLMIQELDIKLNIEGIPHQVIYADNQPIDVVILDQLHTEIQQTCCSQEPHNS